MSTHEIVRSELAPAALSAAGAGWPVFLLGRGKRPLANCERCPKQGEPGAHDPAGCRCLTCHGFYAATTDASRIAAMLAAHPDGLLAVRTGAAPAGAGVVVVDIDPAHGGQLDPDVMTPTLAVASGSRPAGWHLYYRHPGGHVLSRPLPGVAGVDVKADGGYLVLPPSRHPRTRCRYRWANTRQVQEMPPRLAAMITTPPAAPAPPAPAALATGTGPLRTQPRVPGGRDQGGIRRPDGMVTACLAAVGRAPEGRRRTTLYGAARGLARVVLAGHLPAGAAVALLADAGRAAEQTDRDIHAAIRGGFTAEGLTGGLI